MKPPVSDTPKQGTIYWFDPEPVRGSELRKVRPCVVVSPDEMNQYLKTVIIAPVTSTVKAWPFRCTVEIMAMSASIACDQIRVVDKSRLKAAIGNLESSDKKAVLSLLRTIFA